MAACGGTLILGKNALSGDSVTSVTVDSRKVAEGGVFVATPGQRADGHSFVASAFSKGAKLALVSRTPRELAQEMPDADLDKGSYVVVEDTLQALKEIGEYYRQKLDIKVVGITGSVGKTSTKEFIAGVLSEKYNVLKTEGNLNNEIGVPLTLLRIQPEHQVAVVEMGISEFGEMHRLSKMARPDICVITNIGQSHLDNLKTRDGILKAKSEIFDFMAEDAKICLNGGDDKLIALQEIKGRKPHFFGMGEAAAKAAGGPCEVTAVNVVSKGLWGSDARIVTQKGAFDVHVPLPGVHMVLNAAAAACVAELLGLTPEQIASGIGKIVPLSGRTNLMRLPEYTLIDDCYNANPASMRAALDLLALADTEKVAVLGDMFGLGEDNADELHRQVGAYAAEKGIDRIVCVGERARHMSDAACGGAKDSRCVSYFPSLDAFLEALETERKRYVPEGSTVLVKASHAMEFDKLVDYLKKMGTASLR